MLPTFLRQHVGSYRREPHVNLAMLKLPLFSYLGRVNRAIRIVQKLFLFGTNKKILATRGLISVALAKCRASFAPNLKLAKSRVGKLFECITGATKAGSATGAYRSPSCPMIERASDRRNFMLSRTCSTNSLRDSFVPRPLFFQTEWYAADLSRTANGNERRNTNLHSGSSSLVASISGVPGMGVNRLSRPLAIFECTVSN